MPTPFRFPSHPIKKFPQFSSTPYSILYLMLAVALLLIPISCSKGTIFLNNVTFGFLFCLIKWKNRSDACSNYSVRAHKALFRFLSDDFLKGMLFQLSWYISPAEKHDLYYQFTVVFICPGQFTSAQLVPLTWLKFHLLYHFFVKSNLIWTWNNHFTQQGYKEAHHEPKITAHIIQLWYLSFGQASLQILS